MITENVFLQKEPWVSWQRLEAVITKAKRENRITGCVARDVLMCRIVGHDSVPRAVCALYDAAPSIHLWTAMFHEWLRQAQSRVSGAFNHYYLKCCLDRLFAVRKIDHGTIGWWPTDCPSYIAWYAASPSLHWHMVPCIIVL